MKSGCHKRLAPHHRQPTSTGMQMDKIWVENIKSLSNTGEILLRPINFFLGGNSSGKSSLLRLFPLLRQSVESRTIGPLLLFGDYVDYGDFHDILATSAKERMFKIGFELILDSEYIRKVSRYYSYRNIARDILCNVEDLSMKIELHIIQGDRSDSVKTECVRLELYENVIQFRFLKDGRVSEATVNGRSIKQHMGSVLSGKANILPYIMERQSIKDSAPRHIMLSDDSSTLFKSLVAEISAHLQYKVRETGSAKVVRGIGIGTYDSMVQSLSEIKNLGKTWEKAATIWAESKNLHSDIIDIYLGFASIIAINIADEYLHNIASNVLYINPLRATAERFYRPRDFKVDQVDPQGRNLPMYLLNLTGQELDSLARWTKEHFDFTPSLCTKGGHISIMIREGTANSEINLTDSGFGFSQILPVIVQLWHASHSRNIRIESRRRSTPIVIAIEQPELHLHPRLQAMFADALVAAQNSAEGNGIKLCMIIETHSKTLINRVGHLIHKKLLRPETVSVQLFEKSVLTNETIVSTATYRKDGFLQNWPYGFFEAEMA